MRCRCCDANLSDYESTLRSITTNEYLDTCQKCIREIGIKVIDRPDLRTTESITDEDIYEDY